METNSVGSTLVPEVEKEILAAISTAMLRQSRGRPTSTPPGFILPCRPTVADRPPTGAGWVHELKHDGYRLQIHVRDGTGAALHNERG